MPVPGGFMAIVGSTLSPIGITLYIYKFIYIYVYPYILFIMWVLGKYKIVWFHKEGFFQTSLRLFIPFLFSPLIPPTLSPIKVTLFIFPFPTSEPNKTSFDKMENVLAGKPKSRPPPSPAPFFQAPDAHYTGWSTLSLLCDPGRPWTLPLASWMPGLQVCVTTPGFSINLVFLV